MKRLVLVLFSIAIFGFGGFLLATKHADNSLQIAKKYPVKENKKFVVLIMSWNNSDYCDKNVSSVLNQDYENFRVVYINDKSQDDTYTKVKSLIQKHPKGHLVTLINNEKNQGVSENMYRNISQFADDEIVVICDGDDWLANEQVLKTLNAYYANPNVWVTYGQYVSYPDGICGSTICSKPIKRKDLKEGNIRKLPWMTSHLRTFYAGLFKNLKLSDFLYQGKFQSVGADVGLMLPLIDYAREHTYYIDEVLLVYNNENPFSDARYSSLQEAVEKEIRSRPVCDRAKTFMHSTAEYAKDSADIIVFSYDRPLQLQSFLESTTKHIKNLNEIFVIYRTSHEEFEKAYGKLQNRYPKVQFFKQKGPRPQKYFKKMVEDIAFKKSKSNFLAFSVDDIIVKDEVDLKKCMNSMRETGAYGFFLRLGHNINYCYMANGPQKVKSTIKVKDNIHAWQFSMGEKDWAYPNNVDMTLYKKSDIQEDIQSLSYDTPNFFEGRWDGLSRKNRVGLFFTNSAIVNIPANIVNEVFDNRNLSAYSTVELLDKFNNDEKIDIRPFYRVKNSSPHMESEFKFIKWKDRQ